MFGILRPCRHSLSEDLAREWMSHMCGLCLSLRDDHGQASRVATNYDGLVLSVLTAAQSEEQSGTRKAGRCPLRGMRGADVADGSGARLASTVSLMLASAKISDHIADGDGLYARPGVRAVAGRVAARWRRGAQESGDGLGLDGAALAAVVDRQREAELSAREGTDVLTVTRPTEEATGEAFAHTAVLAGVPANADPLREAGRLFGRAAHLLDAVEDLEEDLANGAWNPLTATGTPVSRARELCDDAVLGVGLALRETEFADDRLTRVLLVVELRKAVERVFAHAGHPTPSAHRGGADGEGHRHGAHHHGEQRENDHEDADGGESPPARGGCCSACGCAIPALEEPPRSRGLLAGCATALFMCCTCQLCCRDPHPGPWSGKPRHAVCDPCMCACDVGECCTGCRHTCDCCDSCCCPCCP
ncbi:DUF5685 family protein [Nocardiopsis exhalans]|uniref:DUF5685 family protein n=1 Tax=Nocardiopsis exhalans TaxID=163604 RepID=A0ABY5DEL8_9ACTN|nr:DUF5685 family protein [Nocardiopsis exhalans]USY22462.1 DUF5685 family protein [Nocardiopsis exhalans]